MILGLSCLALLLGIARINRRIPGALIVLALATLSISVFHLKDRGVKVLGPLDCGLPLDPALPPFSLDSGGGGGDHRAGGRHLLPGPDRATTRSAANLGGYDTDINADFRALGLANIASSLVGSFCINASPPSTRSSPSRAGAASYGIADRLGHRRRRPVLQPDHREPAISNPVGPVLIYITIKIFRVDRMRAAELHKRAFA